MKSQQKEQLCQ